MMGFEQKRVQLKVGVMARNLMTEEYPLSERDMTQIDDNHWLLDTQVCNYIGISRFVLGLMSDIEIVDSPEFEQYILKEVEQMQSRLQEIK